MTDDNEQDEPNNPRDDNRVKAPIVSMAGGCIGAHEAPWRVAQRQAGGQSACL